MQNNVEETNSNETITKVCKKCNQEKDINCFNKDLSRKDGYTYRCKECTKLYTDSHKLERKLYNLKPEVILRDKIYKEENNEKQLLQHKQHYVLNKPKRQKYYQDNKEKIALNGKIYQQNNRDVYRTYNRKRYHQDEGHRIRMSVNVGIRKGLNNYGCVKDNPSLYYLGCSIEEYKLYLEQQFLPEMNWNNYGKIWEIDHIIPCISFNLTILDEQLKCFNYINTQPLFKTTKIAESFGYVNYIGNRNKGDKIL